MAPVDSDIRYSPISRPARSGRRRLTRLGSSTFISAMALPAITVPGSSRADGAAPRTSSPAASRTRATPSTRSSPNARLSGAAIPENRPKHSTGMAASTDWLAADRCSAPCSSGKIGGRLVIAARMLMARTMIPAVSSATPVPRTAERARSWPISARTGRSLGGGPPRAGVAGFPAGLEYEAMTGEVSPAGPGGQPISPGELRASHEDRDSVVEQLRVAAGDGRLTADELDERLERALTARTYAELAVLTADLPATGTAGLPAPGPLPQAKDLVRIQCGSGNAVREGRWLVPRSIETSITSGNVKLDFTDAVITGRTLRIDADIRSGNLLADHQAGRGGRHRRRDAPQRQRADPRALGGRRAGDAPGRDLRQGPQRQHRGPAPLPHVLAVAAPGAPPVGDARHQPGPALGRAPVLLTASAASAAGLERAEHVLHDAAVAVVLGLAGGVDADDGPELLVVGPHRDLARGVA